MLCLTFDVEERFHSHLSPADCPRHWSLHDRIEVLIDWVGEHQYRATYFVVGELAEKYPNLIKKMVQNGNEVASHSHSHLKMEKMNAAQCREDIRRSKETLEDITGMVVRGYRSPSWSAALEDDWLWDHLVALGFSYDSSLFPFKTNMYGSFQTPVIPFRLRPELMEIPASVAVLGTVRIPYGGGFYFRLYPNWLNKLLVSRQIRKGFIPILYFHPWDFERAAPLCEAGSFNKYVGNVNIDSAWGKFTDLMANMATMTMVDYARQQSLSEPNSLS